eukprot:3519903-Rhodomonas_salina.1
MQLYLPNPQTRGVLLTAIRTSITESYARLHAYILAEYSPEEYLAMKVWSPQVGLCLLSFCLAVGSVAFAVLSVYSAAMACLILLWKGVLGWG